MSVAFSLMKLVISTILLFTPPSMLMVVIFIEYFLECEGEVDAKDVLDVQGVILLVGNSWVGGVGWGVGLSFGQFLHCFCCFAVKLDVVECVGHSDNEDSLHLSEFGLEE